MALADVSGLKLLLFPELGALAAVVFTDPTSRWARSPRLLVLTPALTALIGIAVSALLPFGAPAVALVVAAGLLVLRGLRSPVAPALSAGYLPLALGIRDWTYPLAIVLGTAALVLIQRLRHRRLPAASAEAMPVFPPVRLWLVPLVVFLAGALVLAQALGSPLVLYPPLLVIAWETLAGGGHCPWRGRPAALLVGTVAAALLGLLLEHTLGPVPLAAFLAVLTTALLLNLLQLTCPPAFAVALVPLVLPHPMPAYPLFVLLGGTWLLAVAALMPSPPCR